MGRRKKEREEVIVDLKSAGEKLGPNLIAEIAEKEWKTAPLPTEEELKQQEIRSPKTRNNVNSRKNLAQYNENKSTETKEKIVGGLKFKEPREKVNPFDFIKLPSKEDELLVKAFLPDRKVLVSVEEEKTFYVVLNSFIQDFDLDELKSSDIEDIVSLAVNRVLENRLLEVSRNDPNVLLDVSSAIEKLRKHSEKVKGNLASRRADRIDPRNKQNFSIVDLVYAFDDKKKLELLTKIDAYNKEEVEFLSEKEERDKSDM
jgi:hypothetical protein